MRPPVAPVAAWAGCTKKPEVRRQKPELSESSKLELEERKYETRAGWSNSAGPFCLRNRPSPMPSSPEPSRLSLSVNRETQHERDDDRHRLPRAIGGRRKLPEFGGLDGFLVEAIHAIE
jgi:hypothetical protein